MIVIPTLHPEMVLRGGTGQADMARFERTVAGDIAKAFRFTHSVSTWEESAITHSAMFPSADECIDFLRRVYETGAMLTFDVETTGESPLDCTLLCIGMGYVETSGRTKLLCLPFVGQYGRAYFSPEDARRVVDALRWVMGAEHVAKCAHNGQFDCSVLYGLGIIVRNWSEDTMLAHHVLDSELPHGLAFVSSVNLDTRFWKDDVKGDAGWLALPDDVLRLYNLRDVLVTMHCLPLLLRDLAQHLLTDTYRNEVSLAHVMMRATIRGIAVDFQRRDSKQINPKTGLPIGLGPQLEIQKQKATAVLVGLSGDAGFVPGKPEHLRKLLFARLGFPVLKTSEKSGLPVIDKSVLMQLEVLADTKDKKAALKNIVLYRQADKFLGTFVRGLHILGDGRLHPSWKLLTNTGRMASSPNVQNWPPRVKAMFRAGPGSKLIGVDLSQAELRFIAYLSRDQELLTMYEHDINVHTVNTCLLFRVRCPNPKDTAPQTEAYLAYAAKHYLGEDVATWPVMDIRLWKPTRTLGKGFVFGGNYGATPETQHGIMRSKRDPDTGDLVFPTLELSLIEGLALLWQKKLHVALPRWWEEIVRKTERARKYVCPISGRVRWFRGGFKRNEILNTPIQTGVASWMNRCTLLIQRQYDVETGGAAQIIQQVHDALTCEAPIEYAKRAGEVMIHYLNQTFELPGFPQARLPADKADIGDYLNEV